MLRDFYFFIFFNKNYAQVIGVRRFSQSKRQEVVAFKRQTGADVKSAARLDLTGSAEECVQYGRWSHKLMEMNLSGA